MADPSPARQPSRKSVLILSGVQYGLPVSDAVIANAVAALKHKGVSANDIYVESLDLARGDDPHRRAMLAAVLRHKLAHKRVGLVMVLNQPALDFLAQEGADLAPAGLPVLTASVRNPVVAWRGPPRPVINISDRADIAGTLRYALDLFPRTRRLVLVAGGDDRRAPFYAPAAEAIAAMHSKLALENTAALSFDEMLQRISSLPPDTLVLLGSFFNDRTGRDFIPAEVVAEVAHRANAPVFGIYDIHVQQGLTGGSVWMSAQIGRRAGEIGFELLSGIRRLDAAVTDASPPAQPMFDWLQLKRWGADPAKLPEGTVFLNRPRSLWTDYRAAVVAATAAMIILSALVLALATQNRRRQRIELARQRAERVMRDETEFSNTMLDSMPGAVYFYDLAGHFLRWNRNFEVVTGYSGQEIAGMHPLDFFSADDRQRVEQRIADVFTEGEATVEALFRSKTGALTPYFFTGRRVVFNQRPCLVGVGIDISERKRAEVALREAETRYQILFEQTPVGVAVVDPQTVTLIDCNEQAARQLGYGRAELVGLPISVFDTAETPAMSAQRTAKLRSTGHDEFQTRHQSRSGEIRDVLVSLRAVQLLDRLVIHCVYLDITERERDAARLRDSEARLVEAQRIAGIGSWTLDIVSDRFTASDQTYAICGLDKSVQVLTRQAVLGLAHPDDHARLDTAQRAMIAGGSQMNLEVRLVLGDGSEKIVHLLGDLKRNAEGQPVLISGTLHDITARTRLAAEHERRERAEAADHIKSAFLATMSHELRTPLNSIIGFTGILLQGLAGPLNPEQNTQLGMVRTSARHLLALVNDVLDISKIEAGQLEIAAAPFDLRHAVDKAVRLIEPQAKSKQLALRVLLEPDLGMVVGDERRFQQIVLNLLSNAVKFTEQGDIVVRAERSSSPDMLSLQVSDTGIGILASDIPSLFQPFRQIDDGLSRQHEGTGLGLAICQRLAGLMGGSISVESVFGAGSTFTLQLALGRPPGT